jgi:hypothetical protein
MAPEPVLTWNLLLTAVAIPALAWYIKHLIDKREKYENKAKKIEQEQNLEREGRIRGDIARLDVCLQSIKNQLSTKVDEEDCEKKCDAKWNMINHHRHDEDGAVVITTPR